MKTLYKTKENRFHLLVIQYNRENKCDIEELVGDTVKECPYFLSIATSRGILNAYKNDYVCRDIYGNIYVIPSPIFKCCFEKI